MTTITIAETNTTLTLSDGTASAALIATHNASGSAHSDIRALISAQDALAEMTDVTISSVGSGEVLAHNGSNWLNQTLAEAGIEAALGNPASNGYILSSTTGGTRSWIAASAASLDGLTDTTITANSAGEVLKWSGSAWINNTLAEAGISATGHTHTESDITDLGAYATLASPTFTGTVTLPGATVTADFTLDNATAINIKNTGGTSREILTLNGSDVIKLGSTAEGPLLLDSSTYLQIRTAASPGLIINSDQSAQFYSDLQVDGTLTVGSGTATNYYRVASGGELEERTPAQVLSDIGAAASSHTHATSDITSGTFADARIAESNVTQHQAAISITESQISNLATTIALKGNKLSVFGATSSAELAGVITNETGTPGSLVFSVSPTFTGTVNLAAMIASGSVVSPVFAPASDSTTAVKITKADKTTAVLTIDTTNSRLTVTDNITSTSGTITANNASLTAGILKLRSSESDAVTKTASARMPSYATSNGDIQAFGATSSSGNNTIIFGGGGGGLKAATIVRFYTAADVTTAVGSERVRIAADGTLTAYYAAVFDANVDMDNIPTSDPAHAGRLWNDSGTLKISAG